MDTPLCRTSGGVTTVAEAMSQGQCLGLNRQLPDAATSHGCSSQARACDGLTRTGVHSPNT